MSSGEHSKIEKIQANQSFFIVCAEEPGTDPRPPPKSGGREIAPLPPSSSDGPSVQQAGSKKHGREEILGIPFWVCIRIAPKKMSFIVM